MANVLFKRGNTATITGTAITDGQLLYDTTTGRHYVDVGSIRKEVGKVVDTALSTTSTNAISNGAITSSIVNTITEVSAITADYIPCGTKPVKELYDMRNGTVLWTNVSPTSSFAGQTVTLSETIAKFTTYEIEYANTNTTTSETLNTGKIKYNRKTMMCLNFDNHVFRRYVTSISGTSIIFSDCTGNVLNPASATTSNARCIPLQIIGYK